jgi:hypothetical protein
MKIEPGTNIFHTIRRQMTFLILIVILAGTCLTVSRQVNGITKEFSPLPKTLKLIGKIKYTDHFAKCDGTIFSRISVLSPKVAGTIFSRMETIFNR